MHRAKSMTLLAGLALLFAAVGFRLFGPTTALVILGGVVAVNWLALGRVRAVILWAHRARPLQPWEAPALFDMARGLAGRADVPMPALMVYPADMPNAFAIGAGGSAGVLAVSSGLLQVLRRREVRGVLAHEFAHLMNRDSRLSLAAGALVQVIGVLSQGFALLLVLMLLFGGLAVPPAALLPSLVFVGLAPVGASLLQAGLMRSRERLADEDAARLTGDPRGLASALHRIDQYSRHLTGWLRRFRFIYTSEGDAGSPWLRTHPATEERVAALLEMEGTQARIAAPVAPARTYRMVS